MWELLWQMLSLHVSGSSQRSVFPIEPEPAPPTRISLGAGILCPNQVFHKGSVKLGIKKEKISQIIRCGGEALWQEKIPEPESQTWPLKHHRAASSFLLGSRVKPFRVYGAFCFLPGKMIWFYCYFPFYTSTSLPVIAVPRSQCSLRFSG